jgi:hypothetical protein
MVKGERQEEKQYSMYSSSNMMLRRVSSCGTSCGNAPQPVEHIVQPLLPNLDGQADDALDPFQKDEPLRPTAGYNPVTNK